MEKSINRNFSHRNSNHFSRTNHLPPPSTAPVLVVPLPVHPPHHPRPPKYPPHPQLLALAPRLLGDPANMVQHLLKKIIFGHLKKMIFGSYLFKRNLHIYFIIFATLKIWCNVCFKKIIFGAAELFMEKSPNLLFFFS